jgi:hypothetical protein
MEAMKRLTILGTLAALAFAQGRQTKEAFYTTGAAGPGYVQAAFLDLLLRELDKEFGEGSGAKMLETLRGKRLDGKRVAALLNGQLTDNELRDLFGLRGVRPQFVRKALDAAVSEKDKRLLFGALARTIVEKGVDPSSEFCQVVGQSLDMTDDQFDRICRGDVSASLMGEVFGLKSGQDKGEMQGYMNATRSSPYLLHPLGASLAGRTRARGEYDPAKFPKARDGMPGYGNDFKEGKAGGLPFDKELPPVPFYGKNLEDYFAFK